LIEFPGGLHGERQRLRSRPRTIFRILEEFKWAVQARAIDSFWESRRNRRLRPKPEQIGQALLAVFAKGVLGTNGIILREIFSGVGFVDVGIVFGRALHLVELKILRGPLKGDVQLAAYMETERRREGWLIAFDARNLKNKEGIPTQIDIAEGRIRVLVVEINPVAPSKKA